MGEWLKNIEKHEKQCFHYVMVSQSNCRSQCFLQAEALQFSSLCQ
jgi:hypothetical protein